MGFYLKQFLLAQKLCRYTEHWHWWFLWVPHTFQKVILLTSLCHLALCLGEDSPGENLALDVWNSDDDILDVATFLEASHWRFPIGAESLVMVFWWRWKDLSEWHIYSSVTLRCYLLLWFDVNHWRDLLGYSVTIAATGSVCATHKLVLTSSPPPGRMSLPPEPTSRPQAAAGASITAVAAHIRQDWGNRFGVGLLDLG